MLPSTRDDQKGTKSDRKRKMSETEEVIVKIEIADDGDDEDANRIELRNQLEYANSIDLPTTSRKQQKNNAPKKESAENDSIVEVKVGDKIFKINMNISQWIQIHKTGLLGAKAVDKNTMTDFSYTSAYQTLPPEDRHLKAFFDSMLRATQRLPVFHQRRIKGNLVKALRSQGVDAYD